MQDYAPGRESEAITALARQIVNAIAAGRYEQIARAVDDMDTWTVELIDQVVEGFKAANELPYIDDYDTPCLFNPAYSGGHTYRQENLYPNRDGKTVAYEYALTTDGQPNDLRLSLTFFLDSTTMSVTFSPGLDV